MDFAIGEKAFNTLKGKPEVINTIKHGYINKVRADLWQKLPDAPRESEKNKVLNDSWVDVSSGKYSHESTFSTFVRENGVITENPHY